MTDRPTKGDPMLDAVLKAENPEFRAWVQSLPPAYWARYDLSACRIGWEAARAADAIESLRRDAERYRWLRENASADLLNLFAEEWNFFGDSAEQLDAGIDAAIEARKA